MPKRENAFKGKAVSCLAIFFMILSGCSNDDSVTDATTEQRTSRAGSASDSEAARENIMKTDIYVRDGSAEETLRKLTSYIEESKRLGFISFESSAGDGHRSVRRPAEEMLASRGLLKGWDAERRRAIILETGATELGCLLNALTSSAELVEEQAKAEMIGSTEDSPSRFDAYAKDMARKSLHGLGTIQIRSGIFVEDIEIIGSKSMSRMMDSSGDRSVETTFEIEINLDEGLAQVRHVRYSMERDADKSAGSVRSARSYRVNDFDEVTGAARTRVVSRDTACVLVLRIER